MVKPVRNLILAALGLSAAALVTPLVAQVQIGRTRTQIVGISKEVNGNYALLTDRHYACPDGQRTRTATFSLLEADLMSGPCDEECSANELNGTFTARLSMVRRNNPEALLAGRGCLTGTWEIRNEGRVTARGKLTATVRADADGTDPENCSPEDYFEGVLEGRATGRQCKGPICATISGSGLDPALVDRDGRGNVTIRIEGSATVPCGG